MDETVLKKVLIVTSIGGFLSKFEMNDVHILQEYGWEVHYASNFQNPVYELDWDELLKEKIHAHPIPIEKSPIHLAANFRAFRQVRRLIDREGIDLIHCHNPMGGVVARLAARFSRRKPRVIYTAHGLHYYEGAPKINWLLFYPVERALARCTNCIITINSEDCESAKKLHLRQGGIVRQIHGVGVDMERFQPRPEMREVVRSGLGIPEDGFHIVTAAELNENKNQSLVIQALKRLNDRGIYYTICGKGPCRQRLEELIRQNGLEDRVRLLGYRTDMEDILQSADCFAFPSRREGLGIAAVEALACGIPVIASDNRGTKEYMQDGINGIVCPSDDLNVLCKALRKFRTDPAYRARLGAQCRPSVARFDISDTDARMRSIYKEVTEG